MREWVCELTGSQGLLISHRSGIGTAPSHLLSPLAFPLLKSPKGLWGAVQSVGWTATRSVLGGVSSLLHTQLLQGNPSLTRKLGST